MKFTVTIIKTFGKFLNATGLKLCEVHKMRRVIIYNVECHENSDRLHSIRWRVLQQKSPKSIL